MKRFFKFIAVVLIGCACPALVQAQQQKRELTAADYGLWNAVAMQTASEKGEWISYKVLQRGKTDTLVVSNKTATKVYKFAQAFDGQFVADRWHVCGLPESVVQVTYLKNGSSRKITDVSQHALSGNGKYLVCITKDGLTVTGLEGTLQWQQPGVVAFSLNDEGTAMVYSVSEQIFYIGLGDKTALKPKKIAGKTGCSIIGFAWQKGGGAFAFGTRCEDGAKGQTLGVSLYSIGERKQIDFQVPEHSGLTEIQPDVEYAGLKFSISDDGSKVFFPIKKGVMAMPEKEKVQVWVGSEALTYGEQLMYGRAEDMPKILVWEPETGICRQLTNNKRPNMFLSGDQQHAVTYNAQGERPYFDYYQKTDYYITDLSSQHTKLFLENQGAHQFEITASPGGKYITYLKNGSWWLYTISADKHINISEIIHQVLVKQNAILANSDGMEIVGWTTGDKGMIVNDGFDLWRLNLGNFVAERITDGRQNRRRFSLVNPDGRFAYKMNFDGFIFPVIDTNQGYVLKYLDQESKSCGYYRWNGKVLPMVHKEKSLTQMVYSLGSRISYYVEEDYDAPPKVMALLPDKKEKVVYRSNLQQEHFHWGHSIVVKYKNSKGTPLQAGLYYPANFDQDNKYPLVVYIYEQLSDKVHDYTNPGLYNPIGFNITNLTAKGYFVLCPDISYDIGDVGISAADCIISATRSVLGTYGINTARIALFGHSFGGYEAAFTATRTNLFTTVIAGAAVTDMTSSYLGISTNSAQPNMWRYEKQQWRMGKFLYEDQEGYRRNSTICNAENIASPLLLFTGEKDGQVDMKQSMELYLALRRLGKPEVMLIYPGEGHVLMDPENQKDFTLRLEQWLDHFLKDNEAPEWIKEQL